MGVPPAKAVDPVLIAAGDIAGCGHLGDTATAALVASTFGTVATLGDHVYNHGSVAQFANCYGPTWGRFKGRTHPAVGNHEYRTPGAAGYWNYFRTRAGARGKGWYSYNLGDWHVIVLNSNCTKVACGKGSEQERWLRADLAAHANKCTLAYWHHPRFSSDNRHGNWPAVGPFWEALYEFGADLVLAGHAHVYERFAPQNPWGKADPAFGIRQFTVGTGGNGLYGFRGVKPNSQVRNAKTLGVLKLTLRSDAYDWNYLPQAGKTFTDAGTTACHGRPTSTGGPAPSVTTTT
ncbi:MAG TPA: metallophosphoesterase, partial [Acidimicrobiia bacterium]|nr:metallophosphoesterase [Acidimicrobiia bacterium]